MEALKQFCVSHKAEDLYKLSKDQQEMLLEVSKHILGILDIDIKIKTVSFSDIPETGGWHTGKNIEVLNLKAFFGEPNMKLVKKKMKLTDKDLINIMSDINARSKDSYYHEEVRRNIYNNGYIALNVAKSILKLLHPSIRFGLATIIHNSLTSMNSIKYNGVYSITQVVTMKSQKYGKHVLFLDDSHTGHHTCRDKTLSVDAVKFLDEQIRTATGTVDLFIESPYVTKNKNMEFVTGTMGWITRSMASCFNNTSRDSVSTGPWSAGEMIRKKENIKRYGKNEITKRSTCKYDNLRTHYIDLRTVDATIIQDFHLYQQVFNGVSRLYYKKCSNMIKEVHGSNITKNVTESLRLIRTDRGKRVFKDAQTVHNLLLNIINTSKIQKQIDNVQEPEVKKLLNEYAILWTEQETIKSPTKKYFNHTEIERVLAHYINTDGSNYKYGSRQKEGCKGVFDSLARGPAVLMDIYGMARLFRTFRKVTGTISTPVSNAVIIAGNFHTELYRDFLGKLGFTTEFDSLYSNGKCADITGLKQPVFRNDKAHVTYRKIPSKCEGVKCTTNKICNPASGRCVLKTGKVGRSLMGY